MVRGALVLELGQAKDSQPYRKQGPALTEPFPLPKVDGAIISALLPLSCLHYSLPPAHRLHMPFHERLSVVHSWGICLEFGLRLPHHASIGH
jgi:hypothetical protein